MGKLSIRDEGVNDLAETLAELMGVNKTEAVRQAVKKEIERQRSAPTIEAQIAALQAEVKDHGFDAMGHQHRKGRR